MQRRTFIEQASLAALMLGIAPVMRQRNNIEASGVLASEFTALRRGVGIFTSRGGTIAWLLRPGASVVVDTQFPAEAAELLAGLQERQNLPQLDMLVNTHHHGDHTSGNPVFKDLLKIHVAHRNSYANQERVARESDKLAEALLPTTLYDDTWSQRVGDETITLHYFGPGHTNGDSAVHFEEANVVHIGDLLFNRRFPYIDPAAGGNFGNWLEVLSKLRKHYDKETLYVFGHAADGYQVTGSYKDLMAMENYIRRLLKYVKKEMKGGTTLDDLKTKTKLIPKAEEWAAGERQLTLNLEVAWKELGGM